MRQISPFVTCGDIFSPGAGKVGPQGGAFWHDGKVPRKKHKAGQPAGRPALCYHKVLLIIVVEEQGLDDHHLVVFLLLHLHVCV